MPRKNAKADRAPTDHHLPGVGPHPQDDHLAKANHAKPVDLEVIIAEIRYWHRQRCFAMEQRKRSNLALGAFLRTMLGWSLALPDNERKEIAERASALLDEPDGSEWESVILAAKQSSSPFVEIEKKSLKEMSNLAAGLPVWAAFGEGIRGFGLASLAVIVAEAGDLSLYSNPAKLWKRMGLAVMGDVRQGGLAKSASKEDWIAHGYNRQRRSRMWNIGDALIKSNQTGEYRALYLERKAYEIAREPEMKPIKAHRRAQRYMEKRLLKNLWQAWRRAADNLHSKEAMPDATISAQAGPTTVTHMGTTRAVSSALFPQGRRAAIPAAKPIVPMPLATGL